MNELTDKLKTIGNKPMAIFILIVVGVILLLTSTLYGKEPAVDNATFDEQGYLDKLEFQIEEIVSSIDGAGSCDVMISVASSVETVYVTENKSSYDSSGEKDISESEKNILTMTDGDGNQYAAVTKQVMPLIGGVAVVCTGGHDSKVKSAVIEAVSTVLNIGANKVCVVAKAN